MGGIYLHIPYCRQACHYCNFHFSTTLKSLPELVQALTQELALRQSYLQEPVATIYLGGGTPSLLADKQLALLLAKIRALFAVDAEAEITLEVNPEDVSAERAAMWRRLGFNRISLGVQSFDDRVLPLLNRAHSGRQAIEAVHLLAAAGFDNISIDLIYGIPGQTTRQWQRNLEQALALPIQHLSCYALTIEERTAWGHWQRQGRLKAVSEATYEAEYRLMCDMLGQAGFEHYEVSNFARPGYRSRHNQAYWHGAPYLGAGPGAHSYNGSSRQANIANNAIYIRQLSRGLVPATTEHLNKAQQYYEYLLTGLRTDRGIDLHLIRDKFGLDTEDKHGSFLKHCIEQGLAKRENDKFVLTEGGWLLADSIIVELMDDNL